MPLDRLPHLQAQLEDPTPTRSWRNRTEAAWTFCPSCGRRRSDGRLAGWRASFPATPCRRGCDLEPAILESAPNEESQRPSGTLAAYVTPLEKHWCDTESGFNFFQALSSAEAASLALIDIKCDFKMVKGGHAPVGNKKKTSVTRASWRKHDIEENLSENARRAFHWLRANNATYERYVGQHRSLLRDRASQEQWHIIPTAQLLLGMPGIEVAARPWLYPTAAFSDTDLRPRLLGLGRITNKQKPSLKTSFARKLTSRCQSYQADFPLFALLHDIALARQVSGMVKAAEDKGIAPDEAASGAQNFSAFWALERAKLEDVCRQRGMPNLFFTIAPAEWKFPLHEGMFGHCGAPAELEKVQTTLALHMRHVLKEVVEQCVLNRAGACRAPGVASVLEYSLRFEFQGRGTLHVHVVAWVQYCRPDTDLSGRTGQACCYTWSACSTPGLMFSAREENTASFATCRGMSPNPRTPWSSSERSGLQRRESRSPTGGKLTACFASRRRLSQKWRSTWQGPLSWNLPTAGPPCMPRYPGILQSAAALPTTRREFSTWAIWLGARPLFRKQSSDASCLSLSGCDCTLRPSASPEATPSKSAGCTELGPAKRLAPWA